MSRTDVSRTNAMALGLLGSALWFKGATRDSSGNGVSSRWLN